MREESWRRVDEHWARFLGLSDVERQIGVVVVEHGLALHDYPGAFVAVRRDQVIVSVPLTLTAAASSWRLTSESAVDPSWWVDRLPGWTVLGPSIHSFVDDIDCLPEAVRARPARIDDVRRELRGRVAEDDWAESGFDRGTEKAWLLDDDRGDVVAAAHLTLFDSVPADVGVLVAADVRGLGHAVGAGAIASRHAVEAHGIARWRSLDSNTASRRTAARLGFEDDCVQLAVRP